mmetsp:Transcript_77868/g.225182  ORF Transcript_77868/g.225182 Transcript_77868/m.225182 type:complete len:306 (+) Transcript_77868:668-1585(+)
MTSGGRAHEGTPRGHRRRRECLRREAPRGRRPIGDWTGELAFGDRKVAKLCAPRDPDRRRSRRHNPEGRWPLLILRRGCLRKRGRGHRARSACRRGNRSDGFGAGRCGSAQPLEGDVDGTALFGRLGGERRLAAHLLGRSLTGNLGASRPGRPLRRRDICQGAGPVGYRFHHHAGQRIFRGLSGSGRCSHGCACAAANGGRASRLLLELGGYLLLLHVSMSRPASSQRFSFGEHSLRQSREGLHIFAVCWPAASATIATLGGARRLEVRKPRLVAVGTAFAGLFVAFGDAVERRGSSSLRSAGRA